MAKCGVSRMPVWADQGADGLCEMGCAMKCVKLGQHCRKASGLLCVSSRSIVYHKREAASLYCILMCGRFLCNLEESEELVLHHQQSIMPVSLVVLSYKITGELKSTALESVGPAQMPVCVVGNSVQM